MEIVKYNKEKHLNDIVKILKSYNWDAWDERAFSNDRHYCVIEDNKILFFSGFYLFDCGIYARLGIQLGNKEVEKQKRKEAMSLLINHIFEEVKKLGVTALEFATANEASASSLIELGMVDNSGPNKKAILLLKEFSNLDYLKE